LLSAQAVPQLMAGALSATSVSMVIPTVTTGSHYLIAKADADDVLDESNEANNSVARAIQIGPDLIVLTLTVPGNGGADSTIVVNDTTKNQGGGAGGASVTRFYLSANTVLDGTDTFIGSRLVDALDAGLSSAGSTTLSIPASIGAGSYYVIATADGDGAVAETSETNNAAARSISIGSDLVVSTISAPPKAGSGATITVTDTTMNLGGGAAPASVTRFYLSTNSVVDAGDSYEDLRGVEIRGKAAVVGEVPRTGADYPALETVERLYAQKYADGHIYYDGRHAWLRVVPDKIVTWDFRKRSVHA